MHWAYCPLPRCALTNNETVWGCSESGLSSHGVIGAFIVPGSGTWVQCRHGPIYRAAEELCLVSVVLELQALWVQQALAVVQAWQAQVLLQGLAGACSVADVMLEVVSVGLTLHSQRCHLMQQ